MVKEHAGIDLLKVLQKHRVSVVTVTPFHVDKQIIDSLPCAAWPKIKNGLSDGACTLLSERTHVYDVANRPWLLPFIYHQAKDPTTKTFLRMLIRAANQTRPEDRPSFAELVHRVNAFGRFDAETYAAVAEAEADEDGGSLDAAAVASSSRRGSGRQHHQCRGRRCRRRQKKKHESGA